MFKVFKSKSINQEDESLQIMSTPKPSTRASFTKDDIDKWKLDDFEFLETLGKGNYFYNIFNILRFIW